MAEGMGTVKNEIGETGKERNNKRLIKIAFPEKFKSIGYIKINNCIYINTDNIGDEK